MKDLVLVTGCSSGIGRAICRDLSSLGYIVIAGVRNEEDKKLLQEEIACTPILLDVTRPEEIQNAVTVVRSMQKPQQKISLINNAGIAVTGPIENLNIDDWRRQFEVNFFGLVALTKELCTDIRLSKGYIVNIGSISGLVAIPFLAPYAATKYAIEAFSDSLRRETYGFGMHVSLIEPGPIQTPIWEKGITNKKNLETNIPEKIRTVYDRKLQKFVKNVEQSAANAIPVERVSSIVCKVLSSPNPKPRYLIASPSSKLGVYLARWLPSRWVDSLFG